jgi:hypothetical protein
MLINYISIKTSIGRFLKELGLDDTAYVEDIPQWTEDAINIIGIPNYYTYRYKLVSVADYKACIPCDLDSLFGVYITNDGCIAPDVSSLRRLIIRNSPLLGKGYQTSDSIVGYGSINGKYVHTSFKEGTLYFVYRGIPIDDEGFPLVPKDPKINEALQYYYIMRMSLSGYKHPVLDFKDSMALWERHYPQAGNSVNWMDLQDYQEFTELWTNPLLGDLHANHYIH